MLVTGAGITGRAVLAALAPLGVAATLCDDNAEALQSYADQGVTVVDPAAAVATIGDYALVVTSPGFPPSAPVLNVNPASGLVPGFLRKFFEYPTARPMDPELAPIPPMPIR